MIIPVDNPNRYYSYDYMYNKDIMNDWLSIFKHSIHFVLIDNKSYLKEKTLSEWNDFNTI